MDILDSLLVALGYELDDSGLKEFEESLESLNSGINTIIASAAAITTAFAGFAIASAQGTDSLTKQAKEANILVGELDAYNFAAEQTIGSSNGVGEALRQLTIRSSEAARGTGSAIEAFAILGISLVDSEGQLKGVNSLLLESADALNQLGNESLRIELQDKLGISNLNLLLKEGSEGIRALTTEARALGVTTEADARAAENFNDQINRLKRLATSTGREIATQLLPSLTEAATQLQTWVQQNRKLIQSRLRQFLSGINFILTNFKTILVAIIGLKFLSFVITLTIALKRLGGAALLANLKIAGIVLAIAAVIASIGLLIQDFLVWQEGGESAIGALIDKFPKLNLAITSIQDALTSSRAWLTEYFLYMDGLIQKTVTRVQNGWDKIKKFIDQVRDAARMIKSFFAVEVSAASPSEVSREGQGVLDILKGFDTSSDVSREGQGLLDILKGFDTPQLTPPAVALAPTKGTNSSVSTTNITNGANKTTININGGDLQKVESTVKRVLKGEIAQAVSDNTQPVRN